MSEARATLQRPIWVEKQSKQTLAESQRIYRYNFHYKNGQVVVECIEVADRNKESRINLYIIEINK